MGAEVLYEDMEPMPHHDPGAGHVERPIHEVTLDAFFISKFEMTQGQWERAAGQNPSQFRPGSTYGNITVTAAHPVERVNRIECAQVVSRFGHALPTEAQWEYACRAGTTTTFSFGGFEPELIEAHSNIADEASKGHFRSDWKFVKDIDDGHAFPAPVGSYAPNGFGLYDMHGNVGEWCLDWFGSYELPTDIRTGLRLVPRQANLNGLYRGGNFNRTPDFARSASRYGCPVDFREALIGVRPIRPIMK